ncbi:hypothetical protein C8J57DRAFT_1483142 [Mycena rebaudengoi]|nr:hypothetical protein C8J57DRAFT_1483142 [Mycena rebaudengoi]
MKRVPESVLACIRIQYLFNILTLAKDPFAYGQDTVVSTCLRSAANNGPHHRARASPLPPLRLSSHNGGWATPTPKTATDENEPYLRTNTCTALLRRRRSYYQRHCRPRVKNCAPCALFGHSRVLGLPLSSRLVQMPYQPIHALVRHPHARCTFKFWTCPAHRLANRAPPERCRSQRLSCPFCVRLSSSLLGTCGRRVLKRMGNFGDAGSFRWFKPSAAGWNGGSAPNCRLDGVVYSVLSIPPEVRAKIFTEAVENVPYSRILLPLCAVGFLACFADCGETLRLPILLFGGLSTLFTEEHIQSTTLWIVRSRRPYLVPHRYDDLLASLPRRRATSIMHECLRLHNISRIKSLTIRSALMDIRKRMVSKSAEGSLMHLGQLLDIVKTEDRAEAQLFLPALFANLDPARIPSSADMDTVPIPEHCLLDAKRAAMSLEAVNAIEIDHAASPDLWDRLWPWFSFLHIHYSAIGRRALPVICEFLVFLQNTDGQKLQSVVTETPGFFLTLAVAWTALLQAPEGDMVSRAFDGINVFFNRGGPWSPSNLEELAEGSGGSADHLSKLVLRHLRRFAPKVDAPRPYSYFQGGMSVVEKIEGGLGDLIRTPLLRHGIITTTIRAMRRVLGTRDDSTDILYSYFNPMARILASSHHRWMVDALKAGVLHFMISYAAQHDGFSSDLALVTVFLHDGLRKSTVYYPIVSQLEISLLDVAAIQDTPGFQSSPFFPEWKSFMELAHRRIKLRHDHDSRAKSLRACDNLGCASITQKQNLRGCVCRAVFYCSKTCQAADWKEAIKNRVTTFPLPGKDEKGHSCAQFSTMTMPGLGGWYIMASSPALPRTPIVFCARTLIIVMNSSGGGGPCPTLEVRDRDTGPPASYLDIDWRHISDRASRSGGKVEMHLMCMSDCGEVRYRLFPMRFATGDHYAALKTLASGDDAISRDEMAALETAAEKMVSFHR